MSLPRDVFVQVFPFLALIIAWLSFIRPITVSHPEFTLDIYTFTPLIFSTPYRIYSPNSLNHSTPHISPLTRVSLHSISSSDQESQTSYPCMRYLDLLSETFHYTNHPFAFSATELGSQEKAVVGEKRKAVVPKLGQHRRVSPKVLLGLQELGTNRRQDE